MGEGYSLRVRMDRFLGEHFILLVAYDEKNTYIFLYLYIFYIYTGAATLLHIRTRGKQATCR